MTRLFRLVWDLLKYLEELNRKPTPWNDEDDILVEGLNNILVMEVKLLRINQLFEVSRDLVNDPK